MLARRQIDAALLAIVALGAVLAFTTGLSNAAFTSTTANTGSSVEALTVAPPTSAQAVMSVNVLPALTCKVSLSWTASTTPGVTTYDLRRVTASTGAVAASWTVTGTSFVDNPVPLQLVQNAFEWQIRSIHGTWKSAAAVAAPNNPVLCLL